MPNFQKESWEELSGYVSEIAREISVDGWRPDYIVGITRGGVVPATMLSHYLKVPMHTLHVALRDLPENGQESNCWMAEDAFGYNPEEDRADTIDVYDAWKRKKILIVDDINDSGATLAWIREDWKKSCCPKDPHWDDVWGNSVRIAVIAEKASSKEAVNYSGFEFSEQDNLWIVFPWEEWWK